MHRDLSHFEASTVTKTKHTSHERHLQKYREKVDLRCPYVYSSRKEKLGRISSENSPVIPHQTLPKTFSNIGNHGFEIRLAMFGRRILFLLLFLPISKTFTNAPGIVFRQNKGKEKKKNKRVVAMMPKKKVRSFIRTNMQTVYEAAGGSVWIKC